MKRIAMASMAAGILAAAFEAAAASGPAEAPTGASVSASTASAGPVFRPFAVYTDKGTRRGHYVASGYMGDGDLNLSGAYISTPNGKGPALRVRYQAKGPKGWSGLYWQDPANNWGGVPGRAGYDLRGATHLIFWARGETGRERVAEFRIGGIAGDAQYPDSDVASLTNVRLKKEWQRYAIDLTGKDLRHIIGGFGFLLNKKENPRGATFYLNDIFYVGPAGLDLPPEPQATEAAPSSAAAVTAPPPAVGEDLKVKQAEEGLRVSFSKRLQFLPGKSLLGEGSGAVLDQLVKVLEAYPANGVLVEGHTDSTGSEAFNLTLSRLRAVSVRDYLIRKGGFDQMRFRVVGYGSTQPIATNATRPGRSLNRRVEVTILKKAEPL